MKKLFKNRTLFFILFILLVWSFGLRIFGYNWDGQFNFHPDERMIGFVVDKLEWDFSNVLSPESKMNPGFFAYGSFPIYLLWISRLLVEAIGGIKLSFDDLLSLGRIISAIFDTVTVLMVFLLTRKIYLKKNGVLIALLSAFSYSVFVLPIQLSHYFAVDTILTSEILISMYLAIVAKEKKKLYFFLLLGISIGLTVATKVTGVLAVVPIVIYLFFLEKGHYMENLLKIITILLAGTLVLFLAMPYALIDWPNFWEQISQQSKLYSDAYAFPYTLQYVDTYVYLYFLKNIFLWGIGPAAGCFALLGLTVVLKNLIQAKIRITIFSLMIILFCVGYFGYMGFSQVKFTRYMLPIYPGIAILTGMGLYYFLAAIGKKFIKIAVMGTLAVILVYPVSFLDIYAKSDTRKQATEWVLKNIPEGESIAVEHWDDRIPIIDTGMYKFQELKMYDQPDDDKKWEQINSQLDQSDYLIIASNRLYAPIIKLNDCSKYKICFPKSGQYYNNLFLGKSKYIKVAEFQNSLEIPILNLKINDQGADESFTVYERPRIIIFKNSGK